MDCSDLKLAYCPFCGSKAEDMYCNSCNKSFKLLTEFGKIPPELIDKINWGENISELQKSVILELLSEMVKIPGGSFTMGIKEINGKPLERPEYQIPHRVTLSPYYLSKFLVTQRQWFAFMPDHDCFNVGEELPVDKISWDESMKFVKKLKELSGISFALPTEAQWFWAAKECKNHNHNKFSGSNNIEEVAWTTKNTKCSVRPGLKKPNALGIYDMSGNMSEHCLDDKGKFPNSSLRDPFKPLGTIYQTIRKGGSFFYDNYAFDETGESYNIYARDDRDYSGHMEDSGLRLAIYDSSILNPIN